jgi:hypothetical protein
MNAPTTNLTTLNLETYIPIITLTFQPTTLYMNYV